MSPAKRLLALLEGVEEKRPGQWVAKCPAHDDRNPSLSIKETDALTVLIKCWAGCDVADVMEAVGLSLSALFDNPPPERTPISEYARSHSHAATAALKSICESALIIAIAGENLDAGIPLTEEDRNSICLAVEKIQLARSLIV